MSGRESNGRFTSGNAGKPKGARNKAPTFRELVGKDIDAVLAKTVEKALDGDTQCIKIILERYFPVRSEQNEQMQTQIDELKAILTERQLRTA